MTPRRAAPSTATRPCSSAKRPHVWGWDIMPRTVSAGIWRPVRLEIRSRRRPSSSCTSPPAGINHQGDAALRVRFQFRTPEPELDGFSLRFHGQCGEHTFDYECVVEFLADNCYIPVPGAKLWWPKGYGDPNLYTVTVQLLYQGQVVAERTERIGIRTVSVERTERAGQAHRLEPAGTERARIDTAPDPEFAFLLQGQRRAGPAAREQLGAAGRLPFARYPARR